MTLLEHFYDDENFTLLTNEPTSDERLEDALKQAELLRRENTDEADNLADRLADREPGDRCRSAACPMCSVAVQRQMVGAIRDLWPSRTLTHFSVAKSRWKFSVGRLAKADLTDIKSWLTTYLEQAGSTDLPCVGFIELSHSFNVETGRVAWAALPHFVAPADQSEGLTELLSEQLPQSDAIPVPVHCVQVRDPARQFQNIYDPRLTRVIHFADKTERTRPIQHWLRPAQATEAALWLGDYAAIDRVFLSNIEQEGLKLRVAPGEWF